MAIKDTLSRLLAEKNMKAVELSRLSGVTEASISEYLSGKKEPMGKQAIAISKALNISLDELYGIAFAKKEPDEHPTDRPYYYALDSGARIKKRREYLGLSQEKAAGQIGIKEAVLSGYEENKIIINRAVAAKLAHVLKCSPDYILGYSDDIDGGDNKFSGSGGASRSASGRKLKEARVKLKMSEAKLAKAVGVTSSEIKAFESGTKDIPQDVLFRLLYVLETDLSSIYQDSFTITFAEMRFMNKYRALDVHGQQSVDMTLEHEYSRCVFPAGHQEELKYKQM